MADTIWKYDLIAASEQFVTMPKDAVILTIKTQHEKLQLWVRVHEENPFCKREILTFGTGHTIPLYVVEGCPYICTVLTSNDMFVWHFFDGGEIAL